MRTQVIRLGRLGATFLAVLTAFLNMPTANAASVTSAVFTGSAGTFVSSTTLYARNGGALTLTVSTSSDTRCVDVTGSHSGHQTSPTAKSSWTFSFVAGSGDGVKSVSASAAPNFNVQGNCTGPSGSGTASYILDNTPPSATASGAPAANNAGWNQGGVTVGIASSDGTGSGVKVTHSSLDGGATVDATSASSGGTCR